MRNIVTTFTLFWLLLLPPAQLFAADNTAMQKLMQQAKKIHESNVDGVRVTVLLVNLKEAMQSKTLSGNTKETHHLMVSFRDAASNKSLNEGRIRVKIVAPDKTEQTKELVDMSWHFGEDFSFTQKGKYGIMSKFKLRDNKVRSLSFWYDAR